MARERIGITYAVPHGVEPVGVYEDENADIEAFITDGPYLLSDGKSLQPPLPVALVDGPAYTDGAGNLLASVRVKGAAPTPISILGDALLAWWTADDTNSLTLAGAAVSEWRDQVAGYAAGQATETSQPAYSVTSFNGAPGVTFDGAADWLLLDGVPFPTGAEPCEVWGIVEQSSLPADANIRCFFGYGDGTTNADRRCRRMVASGVNRANALVGTGAGSQAVTGSAVDFSGRHVVRTIFGASQTSISVDGGELVSVAAVPATASTSNRTTIGAFPSASGGQYWNGRIRDIIVSAPLSVNQVEALSAWALDRRSNP